jgi:2-dehydro-3-deoxyphosphogluconate aldolase/(4S)-4-hydroxy-2-oxoglutarate aldolase
MVKVFPAKFFGPAYLKEVKGPFGDIELLACGGVTPENFREFIKSGASAAAFGESVFRKDYIKEGSFDKIGASVSALVKAALA